MKQDEDIKTAAGTVISIATPAASFMPRAMYFVLPMHTKNVYYGPYEQESEAQYQAAQLMLTQQSTAYVIVASIGVVSKKIEDLSYTKVG